MMEIQRAALSVFRRQRSQRVKAVIGLFSARIARLRPYPYALAAMPLRNAVTTRKAVAHLARSNAGISSAARAKECERGGAHP
jgi:hypothetical protein